MKPPARAIMCQHCGDIIWSRHVHDFRWCSCGKTAIDGGNQYEKITFKGDPPIPLTIEPRMEKAT